MVRGSDDFLERHTESLKHLEPMHVRWIKNVQSVTRNEKNMRMRAYAEVLSVQNSVASARLRHSSRLWHHLAALPACDEQYEL